MNEVTSGEVTDRYLFCEHCMAIHEVDVILKTRGSTQWYILAGEFTGVFNICSYLFEGQDLDSSNLYQSGHDVADRLMIAFEHKINYAKQQVDSWEDKMNQAKERYHIKWTTT